MSSSSDEDDGDYVPTEGACSAYGDERQTPPLASGAAGAEDDDDNEPNGSCVTSKRVTELWRDISASTDVSQRAADKSAKLLKSLISRKQPPAKKKRKLFEFQVPVLSVDVKRTRADLPDTADGEKVVQQVVKFAGVEYSVTKAAAKKKAATTNGGIDQVLAALDAPKKVSTMEKTSLDWDKFKETEGIEDELHQYTKDGYLEKQDFLTRVDLNQFELEKAERDKKRKLLQQAQQS